MTAPFKQVFTLPNGQSITSVVVDTEDFKAFCDQLGGLMCVDPLTGKASRSGDQQIQAIREARFLPAMGRGTRTQPFFDQWEVETDLLCVVERGAGEQALAYAQGLLDRRAQQAEQN